jgi:hypothetical protein
MKTKIMLTGLALIIAGSTTFMGCKKDKKTKEDEVVTPAPTQLEITVLSSVGNKIPNATVSLYDSEANYNTFSNPIITKTTGTDGKALFTDLKAIKYYWDITKDCDDNEKGAITTTTALSEHITNTINVVLMPKQNFIDITSYETESYYYYVNGVKKGTIQANGFAFLSGLSNGTYLLEFKEVDYIFSQTTYSKNVTLSCGAYQSITFGAKK